MPHVKKCLRATARLAHALQRGCAPGLMNEYPSLPGAHFARLPQIAQQHMTYERRLQLRYPKSESNQQDPQPRTVGVSHADAPRSPDKRARSVSFEERLGRDALLTAAKMQCIKSNAALLDGCSLLDSLQPAAGATKDAPDCKQLLH
mmetsp:Transcript_43638/g.80006  ORF Transcript_43638/g.80006 Transcript_43638/m.80006 type:complete len:147 (+) Transcript_43638:1307-1747(+)